MNVELGMRKLESFDFGFGIVDCGMLSQRVEKRAHSVMEEWETENKEMNVESSGGGQASNVQRRTLNGKKIVKRG